jgi:hypothetical protein
LTTVSIIPAESPDGAARPAPIAAADGRFDQFTGSGPILKPGVSREFGMINPDAGFGGYCSGGTVRK